MANILIVDDSAADCQLAGHLLEGDGSTVFYAQDGEEALVQVQEHPLDLVLTDLVMPRLDGLALVERMRAEHPRVPVVLMTARGSEEIAVQALESGAASYVPKKRLVRGKDFDRWGILKANGTVDHETAETLKEARDAP